MTICYHVTPITPVDQLLKLAGRHFMVRWGAHFQLETVLSIGSSVIYDNGAYGLFVEAMEAYESAKANGADVSLDDFLTSSTDWRPYYDWVDPLLDSPTSWAICPDVIGAGSQEQDALLLQWPHGKDRAAPVYHMDEPIDRLLRLLDEWPRVCIGATGDYWQIWQPGLYGVKLTDAFERRMDDLWGAISQRHQRTPYTHGLRMMALAKSRWPFASVDASNAAQNHHRHGGPVKLVDRLDAANGPPRFIRRRKSTQGVLI